MKYVVFGVLIWFAVAFTYGFFESMTRWVWQDVFLPWVLRIRNGAQGAVEPTKAAPPASPLLPVPMRLQGEIRIGPLRGRYRPVLSIRGDGSRN